MSYLFYSWNVNGIRALLKKDIGGNQNFIDWVGKSKADIICLQETKAEKKQIPKTALNIQGYKSYFTSAEKKGYSGVGVYIKEDLHLDKVTKGLKNDKFDKEGRTIVIHHKDFTLINVYVPNGKKNEERLQYKMEFKKTLEDYCLSLVSKGKNVIITGDINTAHNEIDLANPKQNAKTSGFLPIEREWITNFLEKGFIDTFRYKHPDTVKYSWWSMRTNSRATNVGWRIDYFFVSKSLRGNIVNADIHNNIFGSDHCPISLELKF
jgi:exodeoxyribonuclease-3